MGNWTRVNIIGTCDASDIPALRKHLGVGFESDEWGCLHNGGLAGLPNWASEVINAVGNFGERDYDAVCAADALETASKHAPSLKVKAHIGGDNESDTCVATVTLENGVATVGPAEVAAIPPLDEATMKQNMARMMGGRF